jgi:hypothetical protein
MINVKKVRDSSFPHGDVAAFRHALSRWHGRIKKEHPDLVVWANDVAEDDDIVSALLELACWHKIAPEDLLAFLQEQKMTHFPQQELRKRIREGGKRWKAVEKAAVKAPTETESFLGELAPRAAEVERAARLISKSLIEPVHHRSFNEEIATCKQDIAGFLTRRKVREVNKYGWVLLRVIFGAKWKAGNGKDQIEAFRAILARLREESRTEKTLKL